MLSLEAILEIFFLLLLFVLGSDFGGVFGGACILAVGNPHIN
jgi:hypothetical protein